MGKIYAFIITSKSDINLLGFNKMEDVLIRSEYQLLNRPDESYIVKLMSYKEFDELDELLYATNKIK